MTALARSMRSLLLASVLLPGLAAAADPPARYTARVRVTDGDKTKLVPVGTVERLPGGGVRLQGLPAPELDALAAKLKERWAAWKRPTEIVWTQSFPEHTGMSPQHKDHTVVFKPGDKLFMPAMVLKFLREAGYAELGLGYLRYIEYDRSAEYPPGAHDRASTLSNFRKGAGDDVSYYDGKLSVYVSAKVRKGHSPGEGRPSKLDPKLVLAQNNDEGTQPIARMLIGQDGSVSIEPTTAAQAFESCFRTMPKKGDISFYTYPESGEWQEHKVRANSPRALEAQILSTLEARCAYDVEPLIDPAEVLR